MNREEVQLWLDSLHYSAGIFSQLSDEIGLAEEIVKKYELIQALIEAGAVAVIRAENKTQGLKIVEAVRAGGITAIEITMTVPHADEVIRELSGTFGADVLLGAGTVLDAETARACILAGAQ